jgi:hypothetical protein
MEAGKDVWNKKGWGRKGLWNVQPPANPGTLQALNTFYYFMQGAWASVPAHSGHWAQKAQKAPRPGSWVHFCRIWCEAWQADFDEKQDEQQDEQQE